ncbi:MAG: hypothetical protein PHT33_13820 [bacterium]|nr:hypothetical protein [bacterium]
MLKQSQAKTIVSRAQSDPAWWVTDVLGAKLWPKQVEILESLRDNPETAVRSCHGSGKSFTAGRAILWFLYTHMPCIVINTAPTNRQVRGILWKEIRIAHQRANYPLGGKLLTQELKLADDWWAWGFTAPEYDPDRFQGFHEVYILVVVDEAAGVSEPIYEAIDGVLTSENARLLIIGNPTDPTGRFGKAFKTPGVNKITISAFDTPNFTTFGITEEDIASGEWEAKITSPLPFPTLVTPHWVAKCHKRWGPTSALYTSRVKGEFPEQGTDTLIPLSWVEAAQNRELEPTGPSELGVDVARYGEDETVIMHRRGPVARSISTTGKEDTMQTTGRVVRALSDTGATVAKVDGDGLGAGVVDRLAELDKPVAEMRSGFAALDNERFLNRRAEWYWGLRERFETGDVDIDPEDEELAAQLSSIKYKINSRGQIQIESKDDMKKRGMSSPDRADALMLSYAETEDMPISDDIRKLLQGARIHG